MGCCLALAYLVALVRRTWFAVAPGVCPTTAAFAPPARRPAPGGPALALDLPTVRLTSTRRPAARALVGGGLAWFALGVVGMHVFGWFAWADGSLLSDTAFHASGLWVAATGVALLAARA